MPNKKILPILPIVWKPLPTSKIMIEEMSKEIWQTLTVSKENFKSQVLIVPVDPKTKVKLCDVGLLGKIKIISNDSKNQIVEIDLTKRINIKDEIKSEDLDFENENVDLNKVKFRQVTKFKENFIDENNESKLVNKIFSLLDENVNIDIDEDKLKILDDVELNASQIADVVISLIHLSDEDYVKILKQNDVEKRLEFVINKLELTKKSKIIEHEIEEELQKKLEKSQRDYILREKLNTIKSMLGDTGDIDKFIEKSKSKLESITNMKDDIRNRMLEELNKLSIIPPTSSDSNVLRNWIEWMLSMPWDDFTEEKIDLLNVKNKLDNQHFGLEKIKMRILEFLAVRKKKENIKGDIICFVGPPGVGKSTLAKSIAEAINRNFVRISLGGVKDESEIRGHRRTYVGAQPGRIIQSMKAAKSNNPVFLLDEIEKMGYDFKGDPSGALLEVLDPEQNSTFSDHYLEVPYDLSDTLFIATANDISLIPTPLKDRMEIIELSAYTVSEKVEIAVKHLIPKQLERNGITKKEFSINRNVVEEIITKYTFEAGVRNLERKLSTLIRKSVYCIETNEDINKVTITKNKLNEYLGSAIIEPTKKKSNDEVGVVNGMAYTPYGGDIIPIEAVITKGKGRIQITGNLKDVMKESAQIAYTHLKAFSDKYMLDFDEVSAKDIYVHALSGATPKDGPSAGITMALAMYSALSENKINQNVSMTGEISLRGEVLPIGGLKEKSMGAISSGITDVIIPFENKKDLAEIPNEIKDKLVYHPVKHFSEVIKLAVVK